MFEGSRVFFLAMAAKRQLAGETMKNTSGIVALLLMTLIASVGVAQTTVVNFGTVSQFTGPGDLDLSGDIVRAVNFNGSDTTVAGVNFKSDAGDPDFVGPQQVVGWQNRPEYGDTADDDNLEAIMHDIRWANSGASEFLEAHVPVTAGQEYKLQLLISGNHQESRVWDIEIEGMEAVDSLTSLGLHTDTYDVGRSVVYTFQDQAPDDVLDIRMGQIFGETAGDDLNPIWQAMTLELIPEPSAASLMLMSLAGLGLFSRRIRRR